MKKLQVILPKGEWGDSKTKYPPDSQLVGPNDLTAGSTNIDTASKGILAKRGGSSLYAALPSVAKDQYEAVFTDGTRHLLTVDSGTLRYTSGDGTLHQVINTLSPSVNCEFATLQDRVYFGNGTDGKVYDKVTSYGGVSYTFPTQTVKNIGCQVPASAATAAVVAGGSVPTGSHTYKVTYLYYDAEESNGSAASNNVNATAGNQTVNLTAIPVGGYGVTARGIYRDNNDGVYTRVGTISNNTATTFSDTASAGTTPIPVDNGIPPAFNHIVPWLDRLWIFGSDPFTLFYSEPGLPDIFSAENTVDCDEQDSLVAHVVYLDRLVVFNSRSMGQILGKTSDQFRYAPIQGEIGCADSRSIQTRVIDGVPTLIWLSGRGFYGYNGSSVFYLSDSIEDQVLNNFNIAASQKGHNTQSSETDFQQGVSSGGIDLTSSPGDVTTPNPQYLVNTQAGWEAGVQVTDVVTRRPDIPSELAVVKGFTAGSAGEISGTTSGGMNMYPASSGLWLANPSVAGDYYSPVYDSGLYPHSEAITVVLTVGTISYSAPSSSDSWYIEQADSADMLTGLVSFSAGAISNAAVSHTFAATKRYWRIHLNAGTSITYLSSVADPASVLPSLKFPTTATWISPTIDHTSDITTLNSLTVVVGSLPAGTTATAYIQKSTSSGSGFVDSGTFVLSVGTNTPSLAGVVNPLQRYSRIKIVLVNTSSPTNSPEVVSAQLNWTVVATLKAFTVDTGVTPTGWDVFQVSDAVNGGAIAFYMRSGPSLVTESGVQVPGTGGVPASWIAVTPGAFPVGVSTTQYVQWKVTITSTAGNVPVVSSVTVNWFSGAVPGLRVASLFFNKSYYIAVADINHTYNNLLFEYDQNGKWRARSGLNVATIGRFSGSVFFTDSVTGNICAFLKSNSDLGAVITFDFRSRAFDFSSDYYDNQDKVKIVESAIIIGRNTGASYTCSYSLDEGESFNLLYDTAGNSTWTVGTDGKKFVKFLRPRYTTVVSSGRTVMLRIYNSDTNTVEIDSIKFSAFVRTQPPIITG